MQDDDCLHMGAVLFPGQMHIVGIRRDEEVSCMMTKRNRIKAVFLLFCCLITYGAAAYFQPSSVQAQENESVESAEIKPSELYARSAVLMDAESGRILFAKNGREEMPMASTTKIKIGRASCRERV